MKYKVVIIDDEPWTREVIKSLADWENHDMSVVGEASDGLCGLELVTQLKPDVIITDVKMPGLDGLELLAALRKEKYHAKTIVISGHDDFSFLRNALKLNVIDYLLKPVKKDELNEQLARCKEQLQEQLSGGSDSKYNASAFMAVEWIKEYTNLREQLYSCLSAQDRKIIESNIQTLQQSILRNEGNNISIQLMICIYYDLMHSLERFIVTNGYTVEEIFEKQNVSYVFHQEVKLHQMLDFIGELYIKAAEDVGKLKKSRNRINVKQIKEYVDANYTDGITLEQVADTFYLSKEYLSKLFKKYTGNSFSDYITEKRMKKSYRLICEYKVPIKEVVSLVGYVDQAHFYKMFKKYYGMTPGDLQRKGS